MRKLTIVILVGFLTVAVTGALFGQTQKDVTAQRAKIQSNRMAIVSNELPLTKDQAAAFWPLYEQYRGEIQKVGDRMTKLITDYASSLNSTLTDEQAALALKEFLAVQGEMLKIKEQFVPRFRAILPAKSVLRFYQIENKLDVYLMNDLVAQIPLAN